MRTPRCASISVSTLRNRSSSRVRAYCTPAVRSAVVTSPGLRYTLHAFTTSYTTLVHPHEALRNPDAGRLRPYAATVRAQRAHRRAAQRVRAVVDGCGPRLPV